MTLPFVNVGNVEWVERVLVALPEGARRMATKVIRALKVDQPRSLRIRFEHD